MNKEVVKIIIICLIIALIIGIVIGINIISKNKKQLNKTTASNEIVWYLENNYKKINDIDVDTIKAELDKVCNLESEHLILVPSESINNTTFVQTYNDANDDIKENFHVEIGVNENANDYKILYIENLTEDEAFEIFKNYYENSIVPDLNDWQELEWM